MKAILIIFLVSLVSSIVLSIVEEKSKKEFFLLETLLGATLITTGIISSLYFL